MRPSAPRQGAADGHRRRCGNPPYGSHIGALAVGKAADLVLIDWEKLAYPYLDPETPVLDAALQRAKTDGVDLVMVAGDVVYPITVRARGYERSGKGFAFLGQRLRGRR